MSPNAPAPEQRSSPVTSTTGSSARLHARARVMLSVRNSPRPIRTSQGAISAESASEPVKMSVGPGRDTTAGETAVAKSSPERASQPIAKTLDPRQPRRHADAARAEDAGLQNVAEKTGTRSSCFCSRPYFCISSSR